MHPSLPHVEPTPRRIRVRVGGELVADTERARLLIQYGPGGLPTYHLPRDDVRPGLRASDLVTVCPYKGTARYWSVEVGGTLHADVAWSYPAPIPENPKIKDLICFFAERVDTVVDGRPVDRPRTSWSPPDA